MNPNDSPSRSIPSTSSGRGSPSVKKILATDKNEPGPDQPPITNFLQKTEISSPLKSEYAGTCSTSINRDLELDTDEEVCLLAEEKPRPKIKIEEVVLSSDSEPITKTKKDVPTIRKRRKASERSLTSPSEQSNFEVQKSKRKVVQKRHRNRYFRARSGRSNQNDNIEPEIVFVGETNNSRKFLTKEERSDSGVKVGPTLRNRRPMLRASITNVECVIESDSDESIETTAEEDKKTLSTVGISGNDDIIQLNLNLRKNVSDIQDENSFSEANTQVLLPDEKFDELISALQPPRNNGSLEGSIGIENPNTPSSSASRELNSPKSLTVSSTVKMIVLSPNKSNDTKSPRKSDSPKATKPSYYSPIRHLRKASSKRLFPSDEKMPDEGNNNTNRYENSEAETENPTTKEGDSSSWPSTDESMDILSNFQTILNTVMKDDTCIALFNSEDREILNTFSRLSRAARILYVRISQRGRIWYPQSRVVYPKIAGDLSLYFAELCNAGLFTEIKEFKPFPDVEVLLDLLNKDEINTLANRMHVGSKQISSKQDCKTELLKMSKTQRTLTSTSSSSVLSDAIVNILGPTYTVSQTSRSLFSRVFMLYDLPMYWDNETNLTSNKLLTMMLTKVGKMEYPKYEIRKSILVFRCRDDLICFQDSLSLYSNLEGSIECKNWNNVVDILREASEKFKTLIMKNEEIQKHDANLPTFLRIFTAGSVLIRTIWLGVEGHQKLKEYDKANTVIDFLLRQGEVVYLTQYRGRWHERKIVNLKHLKTSNREVEQNIIKALSDPFIHDNHRLGLSERLVKLRETMKDRSSSPDKEPRPKRRRMRTRSLSKKKAIDEEDEIPEVLDSDQQQVSIFALKHTIRERTITAEHFNKAGDGERVFGKSTFLGSRSTLGSTTLSSVEERALSFYREEGYHAGIHCEGSVPVTLYGLLFWDIIYMDKNVTDVFRSPFQPFPLDLHYDDFYIQRKDRIDDMLRHVRHVWSLLDAFEVIERNWKQNFGKISVVIWNTFESLDQVKVLIQSMGLQLLANILERLAKNFRDCAGFPDLIVWNETDCRFVEVKGPNDKLSHKQSIWLDYLTSVGANAEVCHVKSLSNKRLH